MKIEKNKVVSVSYELHVDTNGQKQLLDKSQEGQPLLFLVGVGQMIPGFEKNLLGLAVGDAYDFVVAPHEGYGEYSDEDVIDLPADVFKVDGEIDLNIIRIGNIVPLRDNQGNTFEAKILEVSASHVKVDLNHELAGKELHFSGKVISVREATADELSHGHAHGHGGVMH
ncbi:MAG: peptidylprolyl isomerase [Cytophagales bacterium]